GRTPREIVTLLMSDQDGNASAGQPPDDGGDPPLGAVLDFMRLLWAVDHALQSASKRMEATFGVTGPQRLVVRIVGRFPGIAAGRVAQILHVHPSTLKIGRASCRERV